MESTACSICQNRGHSSSKCPSLYSDLIPQKENSECGHNHSIVCNNLEGDFVDCIG